MQRWWYIEDKNSKSRENSCYSSPKSKTKEKGINDRKWTFKVLVTLEDLLPNEQIAISGDCAHLGNWDPNECILMEKEEGSNLWITTVDIPGQKEIAYRFVICAFDSSSQNIHIRKWETHIKPRIIPAFTEIFESYDTFGDINGIVKIDRGWITTETIFQFMFYNNPFMLKDRNKNRLVYVKLTPINLRVSSEGQFSSIIIDESLSNDTRENGTEPPAYAFTEVVTLGDTDCKLQTQEQFGRAYHPNDILMFHVTVSEPENVAYLIDLYTYSSKGSIDEPPYHLGYHYILPNFLKKSEGNLELPVTCASKHRPLGMIKLEYLKITPYSSEKCNLKFSYIRHWNRKWTGLEVGHRGSGTSFKAKDLNLIRENTIASLKKAAMHGADMVEFDVQLSKDFVPVIYHDFSVYVSLKRKTKLEINDMLELPMAELTLEQLKHLKVYHLVEGQTREERFFDEELEEHQPFPTLSDVLDVIDTHVGFNIEIKWSMRLEDGTWELNHTMDKNLYLDCILDVVMTHAGKRRIVFSCFDPDICTMLRFKQNLYPVMFLTIGSTNKYPKYYDPRCNSHERAIQDACAMELLGIVGHTEDLLRDPTQIQRTIEQGLVIFCWGDENNCPDTIRMLKKQGMHAIIYDKMDVFSTKERKINIFMPDAQVSKKELLQMQEIEKRKDSIAMHAPESDFINSPGHINVKENEEKGCFSTSTSIESLNENHNQ